MGTDHGVDQIRRTLNRHQDRQEELKSMMNYLGINADNSIVDLQISTRKSGYNIENNDVEARWEHTRRVNDATAVVTHSNFLSAQMVTSLTRIAYPEHTIAATLSVFHYAWTRNGQLTLTA